jgi:hypothetical protein
LCSNVEAADLGIIVAGRRSAVSDQKIPSSAGHRRDIKHPDASVIASAITPGIFSPPLSLPIGAAVEHHFSS